MTHQNTAEAHWFRSNKYIPSGLYACISSRITTVIQVVRYYQINYNWYNEPFAVSQYKAFILRHAWLNLLDERMTTGRINQVAIVMIRTGRSWNHHPSAPYTTASGLCNHCSCGVVSLSKCNRSYRCHWDTGREIHQLRYLTQPSVIRLHCQNSLSVTRSRKWVTHCNSSNAFRYKHRRCEASTICSHVAEATNPIRLRRHSVTLMHYASYWHAGKGASQRTSTTLPMYGKPNFLKTQYKYHVDRTFHHKFWSPSVFADEPVRKPFQAT